MVKTVKTPMAEILDLTGSLYIVNGQSRRDQVVSSVIYYRDRSPVAGQTVAEALPELVARVKASRCRNPRDSANHQGCEMDHSFEVPGLPFTVFDDYLRQIAELLWLVGPTDSLMAVGLDQGQPFHLEVGHNHASWQYDVRLDLDGGLKEYLPSPWERTHDKIHTSAETPEAALESAIAELHRRAVRQLAIERAREQFKRKHAGKLGHANHPNFIVRDDNTVAITWQIGKQWFCAIGEDHLRAIINGLAGRLTCGHDGGRGCVLAPHSGQNHQQPENLRYRAGLLREAAALRY